MLGSLNESGTVHEVGIHAKPLVEPRKHSRDRTPSLGTKSTAHSGVQVDGSSISMASIAGHFPPGTVFSSSFASGHVEEQTRENASFAPPPRHVAPDVPATASHPGRQLMAQRSPTASSVRPLHEPICVPRGSGSGSGHGAHALSASAFLASLAAWA